MSKTYLPYEPDQQLLLPAALQEWLPDDHLAYFISDVVDQLDMWEVTARYERERRGGPPYHPRMMVKVLLYGYCVGVASSRRIAQRLHEDIAFRVLAANNTPDFRTISDFRKDNVDALSGLFVQVLALCQQAGLVKLGHVALDGTKVKANASKHKAMSYQRMKEKAAQLAAEVAELLRQAQAADDEEGRRFIVEGDEIVLSAGGIASPQLLMLSGVGPADHLGGLGIPVVHDLPGVGQNLRDHPSVGVLLRLNGEFVPGPYAPWLPVSLRYTADGSATRNDVIVSPAAVPLGDDPTRLDGIRLGSALYLAISSGELRLTSTDPRVQPHLDYRYLEDPWDRAAFPDRW